MCGIRFNPSYTETDKCPISEEEAAAKRRRRRMKRKNRKLFNKEEEPSLGNDAGVMHGNERVRPGISDRDGNGGDSRREKNSMRTPLDKIKKLLGKNVLKEREDGSYDVDINNLNR